MLSYFLWFSSSMRMSLALIMNTISFTIDWFGSAVQINAAYKKFHNATIVMTNLQKKKDGFLSRKHSWIFITLVIILVQLMGIKWSTIMTFNHCLFRIYNYYFWGFFLGGGSEICTSNFQIFLHNHIKRKNLLVLTW